MNEIMVLADDYCVIITGGVNGLVGSVGTEILRVEGDAYIDGKLTVTGLIDPTAVLLSDPAAGTDLYFQSASGATAAVSPANTGRIRYNTPTQTWQISMNGSAYADISTGGGGPWQTTAGVVNLTTPGDTVTIGSAVAGAKLFVDGDANEVQFTVQGFTGQSANLMQIQNVGGTNLAFFNSSGYLTVGETFTGVSGITRIAAGSPAGENDILTILCENTTGGNASGARFVALGNSTVAIHMGFLNTAYAGPDIYGFVGAGDTYLVSPVGDVDSEMVIENMAALNGITFGGFGVRRGHFHSDITGGGFTIANGGSVYTRVGLVTVIGSTDEVQLDVRAVAAQDSDVFRVDDSLGAPLFAVSGPGPVGATGPATRIFQKLATITGSTAGSVLYALGEGLSAVNPAPPLAPRFLFEGGDMQFATGAAVADFISVSVPRPTITATAATQTITRATGLFITAPAAGTNVSITSPFAIRTSGAVDVEGFTNVVQMAVRGVVGQSEKLFVTETSTGNDLFSVNANGFVGINAVTGSNFTASFLIHAQSETDPAGFFIDAYGGGVTGQMQFRAASGTVSAPTAVASGRVMGVWGVRGYDGGGFVTSSRGSLRMVASETWTGSANGVELQFNTTANGATASATRYTIENNGNFTMEGNFDFIPLTDNTGEVGIDAARFTRVRAVSVVTGDLELLSFDKSKSWALREGTDSLWAINRRNGKKYRVMLEEVDEVEERHPMDVPADERRAA